MQKTIQWKQFIGQQRIKQILESAFRNNSLGHAYIFCGSEGVGTFAAAVELFRALLCEHPETVPCYVCESCRKIDHYSHPDFQCVFPVALEDKHKSGSDAGKLSDDGWAYIAEQTVERIAHPFALSHSRMLSIPVEWIRELNHAIMRGSVGGTVNCALICDVDLLAAGAANAMLKTLEEPPAGTIMILLTQRLWSVLPTIRSRCQVIRFGLLADEDVGTYLSTVASPEGAVAVASPIITQAEGNIGKGLDLLEEDREHFSTAAAHYLNGLLASDQFSRVPSLVDPVVDGVCGGGQSQPAAEQFLAALLYLIRDNFFGGMQGRERYITQSGSLSGTGQAMSIDAVSRIFVECESAFSAIRSHGNIQLILLTMTISMMEIIHGKKQ